MTQAGTSFYSRQTYFPYGAQRTTEGSALPTDYTFTGQKNDDSTGLMFYGARYYDVTLGRFTQPDTIVPNPLNPQSLNRFSYTLNNPVRYIDPSGHAETDPGGGTSGEDDEEHAAEEDEYVITTANVDEFPNPANTPSSQYPNGRECCPKCNKEANGGVEIPSGYFKYTSGKEDEEKGAAPIGGGGGTTTGGNERVPGMGTGACTGISAADCARLSGYPSQQTTILGENMTGRVQPFADRTGARTLGFGTTEEKWNLMTSYERWKLNDGQLRARINEGDNFRYLGIDPARDPLSRQRFDLTRSEILRMEDRGILYERVSPDEIFRILGRY